MKRALTTLFEKPEFSLIEPNIAEAAAVAKRAPRRERRLLLASEVATVAILVAITFLCVRPLLEEWGLFRAFKVNGLGYVEVAFSHTMRPLHLFPYALQWVMGGAWHNVGVAAATATLLVLRYAAARWAVTPFLYGNGRWIVATMAATLVPWQGAWLGRYTSAQTSTVLFFVVLGAVIRLYHQWSVRWTAVCAVCVYMLLATYQGLFLCFAVVPFAILLWREKNQPVSETVSKLFRTCFAMALGGVFYGVYWIVIFRMFGSAMYEETLASDSSSLLTVTGAATHIEAAFNTAYLLDAIVLPFLACLTLFLCWEGIQKITKRTTQWRVLLLIFGSLVILPLLSLIYVNMLHLHDPERVRFPISVGEVLISLTLLIHLSTSRSSNVSRLKSSAIVVVLIASSALTALTVRKDGVLQQDVIHQASVLVKDYKPQTLIVRDLTGTLGDVYTLYQTVLQDALLVVADEKVIAMICTPLSVDRLHPVANRFPIASTPRCEDLPEMKSGVKANVLVTHWDNGKLTVDAEGSTRAGNL